MTDGSLTKEFRGVEVVSHAGYRGAEQPVRVALEGRWWQVTGILKRWREPEHEYVRVRLDNGSQHLLRHTLDTDDWEIAEKS
jgi:hypothetical protein